MSIQIAIMGLVGFTAIGFFYWDKFFSQSKAQRRWFAFWFLRGALLPIMIWCVFNSGIFGLPPILPNVEVAVNTTGKSLYALLDVTARGTWVIGSYWCAITLGWVTILVSHQAERRPFLTNFGVCSLLTLPLALSFFTSHGLAALGIATVFWLVPVVHFTVGLLEKEAAIPSYSAAIAKMQMGRYDEAEAEVIKQLEMCEEDYEGWMMLATLYAEQNKDLKVAEQTIFELCAQSNVNISQASSALHRLADWHLKIGEDPIAARRVLAEINKRYPGSHVAKMAEQRRKQIPESKEEWMDQQKPRALHLPSIGARLFEGKANDDIRLDSKNAAEQANKLTAKLKMNPNDIRSREEFARLLADHLGKADAGIEQVKLLLEMPEQLPSKRAEWFGLLAAWELKYRRDIDAARRFLERVTRDFPKTPQAFAAQKQLHLIDIEARLKKAKLPSPEQLPKIQVS